MDVNVTSLQERVKVEAKNPTIWMLSEVGLAIAMGNASTEVKEVAKWGVGSNDAGGVAEAVQRLLCDREAKNRRPR